ncbi:nucleotidyl transferase AbiEii/AbiGii toxin family protein [Phocaeicola massiliensis]|jgi:predicted nucleotidyltransferase component of viral defense system|uniref:nucleotidyl transferase AbiEii/AbiGii toxin family protein n=1 Tax=Phocaeicola massiliensis TaxID=204516 RepID=UPI00189A8A4B|nr:nucleotidyl transferase AbiEii/AbiGii toxin family protein [Phocaeicola massiliensis]
MSKEQNKNYGKSIRTKLLNVAKKENVFYQTILTRYFQERLLYRMSQSRYRNNFYLKGGALMYAYERFAARPTLDIDFLGNNISNEGTSIIAAFKEICSVPFEEDGVIFDVGHITAQNITEFKDYHGIRLSIPVKMDSIAQVLTMDIGFGDVVTPSPVNLDFPILLEHLPCANILAYSLETVIAEKMHAIIDLADQSSRMKDYYDLHRILKEEKYDSEVLQEAIIRTFENRHTPYDENTMFFRKDFGINQQMEARWKAFMRKITKATDLSFSEVVGFIQETLRPYWENIPHE